jgi:hypothetical protein
METLNARNHHEQNISCSNCSADFFYTDKLRLKAERKVFVKEIRMPKDQ